MTEKAPPGVWHADQVRDTNVERLAQRDAPALVAEPPTRRGAAEKHITRVGDMTAMARGALHRWPTHTSRRGFADF